MTLASASEPPAGRVTVVIACYNQAHFLRDALDSALRQTQPAAEILVVDDGSTDDTAVVAARCREARCIRQHNRGVAAARNAGLAVSTGDYIIFLDADDRLLPNAIADGLASLTAHPNCAFTYGHVRLIDSQGASLGIPEQTGLPDDPYLTILHHNYIWTTGAVISRRSVFHSVDGFDPRVNASADFELNARILNRFPIRCTDSVVLEYRRHGTNMTADFGFMLES